MNIQCEYLLNTLVEHFKFFGVNIGGKCFWIFQKLCTEKVCEKKLETFLPLFDFISNFPP
jgi:hypothetical protein